LPAKFDEKSRQQKARVWSTLWEEQLMNNDNVAAVRNA
jgi:hypothetical protein